MLKSNLSLQVLVVNKMLAANKDGGIEDGDKLIEKDEKLSKTRKTSKVQKLSKSQKSAMSKKLSKSRNLLNFDAKDNKPSFLTPKARATFNRLRLAFITALIVQYFYAKCHIWIVTHILSYSIGGVLS